MRVSGPSVGFVGYEMVGMGRGKCRWMQLFWPGFLLLLRQCEEGTEDRMLGWQRVVWVCVCVGAAALFELLNREAASWTGTVLFVLAWCGRLSFGVEAPGQGGCVLNRDNLFVVSWFLAGWRKCQRLERQASMTVCGLSSGLVIELLNREAASWTGTICFSCPWFFGGKVWAGGRKCQRSGKTSINDGYALLMHSFCISYGFLMHFLCTFYALLYIYFDLKYMHFLCTSYAPWKSA